MNDSVCAFPWPDHSPRRFQTTTSFCTGSGGGAAQAVVRSTAATATARARGTATRAERARKDWHPAEGSGGSVAEPLATRLASRQLVTAEHFSVKRLGRFHTPTGSFRA